MGAAVATSSYVKLDSDAVIAEEKLRYYPLAPRPRNDKSRFFARAGYNQGNWRSLEHDVRQQVLPLDDEFSRSSIYGSALHHRSAVRVQT